MQRESQKDGNEGFDSRQQEMFFQGLRSASYEEIEASLHQYPHLLYAISKENNLRTALHMSASDGREDVVHLLVESGALVNQQCNDNRHALQYASMFGHTKVAEYLIQEGSDVDQYDVNTWTSLHHAAMNGRLSVLELLITLHAHPGITSKRWGTARDLVGTVMVADSSTSVPIITALQVNHCDYLYLTRRKQLSFPI